MKKTLAVCLLTVLSFTVSGQDNDCNCPRPRDGYFINICALIEQQDFAYTKELMAMSCVDQSNDSKETIKEKVNCLWEKYYSEFGCQNKGFLVVKGNALKYSANQGFEYFIDGVVEDFGFNINIKDPSDNKTLLDFILDEINRFKRYPTYQYKVKEFEELYSHLKNDLNAKHASELTPQDVLPYRVKKAKITVSSDILKKYEGKYIIGEGYKPIYIKMEGDKLICRFGDDGKANELNADSKTSFFRVSTPAFAKSEFTFKPNDANGKFDLILYQDHKNFTAKRID